MQIRDELDTLNDILDIIKDRFHELEKRDETEEEENAKTWPELVEDFNDKFEVPTVWNAWTEKEYEDTINLQWKLIEEEQGELDEALHAHLIDNRSGKEAVLDGICDNIYVLIGLALKMGFDIEGAFREVHKNNMSKWPPIKDENGKVQKHNNHRRPDLRPFIN